MGLTGRARRWWRLHGRRPHCRPSRWPRRPPTTWEVAAAIGAASLADPTGALTDRALRNLLPIHRSGPRVPTGDPWVQLDRELDRRAIRAGLIDSISPYGLLIPPVDRPYDDAGGDSPL